MSRTQRDTSPTSLFRNLENSCDCVVCRRNPHTMQPYLDLGISVPNREALGLKTVTNSPLGDQVSWFGWVLFDLVTKPAHIHPQVLIF